MSKAPIVANFEEYQQRRFFGALDGLRAASILAVIWHHTIPADTFSLPMLHRGFLGVDMFFVLSGFLIVTLLLRERNRTGNISLKKFYARRTLRIFPVYYAVLAFLCAIYLLHPDAGSAPAFFAEIPFHATYTSNWIDASIFGITWSLATEEQFYLFWPPVERLLRPVAIPILLLVIAFCQLVNFGVLDFWLSIFFGDSMESLPILQTTFTPICFGVLIAHSLHSKQGFDLLSRICGKKSSAPFIALLLVLACNIPAEDISGSLRLIFQLLMACLLICLLVREDHGLQPLLSMRPLRRMGAISYGMYLFHIFIVSAAIKILTLCHFQNPLAVFFLTALLTVGVAEASFRWFENPILRLKRRFAS